MDKKVNALDRAGVADRLRQLLSGQENGDMALLATRLGVEEVSLRMSVDADSPHPTIEVLAAVIGEYGIDPTWLLTGVYNSRTHRDAMEDVQATHSVLAEHLSPSRPRISEPSAERPRFLDHN